MTDPSGLTVEFARSIAPTSLHLVILPTEKCNFRCSYCYEDFAVGRMSDETVAAVQAFLTRRAPSLSKLFVEWFGGEPLLAPDVIRRVSQTILDCRATRPIRYDAGITTNGWYLDVSTAEKLVSYGITRAQVSLDGPRRMHDSTRTRLHGEGSYDRIHGNLRALRASTVPMKVLLRVHLTPENAESMRPFVDELKERYLDDARFSLLLTPVGHLGGPNDPSFRILDETRARNLIFELSGRSDGAAVAGKGDRVDLGEARESRFDVCYAAKMNSLVIRADGTLAKCTVALSNDKNAVGRIERDGSLTIFDDKVRTWTAGWYQQDLAALACPLEHVPELVESRGRTLPLLR